MAEVESTPRHEVPGPKTSEFKLTVVLLAVGVLLVVLGEYRASDLLTGLGGTLLAASGVGYQVSRGLAKR